MSSRARLFVVSAPSGCGKGTLLKRVFENREVYYSVSYTTRQPRPEEKEGVNYFYVKRREFEKMIDDKDFLEYTRYVDNYYGTPKEPVFQNLARGIDVVLEIETRGAFAVKEAFPDAVLVFILPPSFDELERRLRTRATEDLEIIDRRVREAKKEIVKAYRYDYVVLNDDIDVAVDDFVTLMNSVKNEDKAANRFSTEYDDAIKIIEKVISNA